MTGRRLTPEDEHLHTVGPESSWNESRYVDFHDSRTGLAGWFRLGMRPNERHAEVSSCLHLPDGRTAFFYERAPIDDNGLSAGGQHWSIQEPYISSRLRFGGQLMILPDPWMMTDPKTVYASAARQEATVDLRLETYGLGAVMGADQADIDRIFLPGQADGHYQHLCRVTGSVTVGEQAFQVDGAGGKDHSWGPRNWLSKLYFRWLVALSDDNELGFMLVRAVGPSKQTRSGHVWADGALHLVDDVDLRHTYESTGPYRLLETAVTIRSGHLSWEAVGAPQAWLPLRHVSTDEHGARTVLRIVKSPARWTFADGRGASGACELHDRLDVAGIPVGPPD